MRSFLLDGKSFFFSLDSSTFLGLTLLWINDVYTTVLTVSFTFFCFFANLFLKAKPPTPCVLPMCTVRRSLLYFTSLLYYTILLYYIVLYYVVLYYYTTYYTI